MGFFKWVRAALTTPIFGLKNLLTDPIAWGIPNVSASNFSSMGLVADPNAQLTNGYQLLNHSANHIVGRDRHQHLFFHHGLTLDAHLMQAHRALHTTQIGFDIPAN